MDRFVEGARAITVGDPMDPETPWADGGPRGGPAHRRVGRRGRRRRGEVLAGGKGDGQAYPATVLTDVPRDAAVCTQEAFAPTVVAAPFDDFEASSGRSTTPPGSRRGCSPTTSRMPGRRSRSWRWGRHPQRRADLPHRPHALRRGQGLGSGPRGPALRHRGYDRAAHPGPRPARLSSGAPEPRMTKTARWGGPPSPSGAVGAAPVGQGTTRWTGLPRWRPSTWSGRSRRPSRRP